MKTMAKVFHFAVLWILLWFLYLISAGESGPQEMVTGAVVSVAVAALSLLARSTSEERFIPRLRWLVPFLKVPWTVLQESWLLLLALLRKLFTPSRFQGGSFLEYQLPPAPEDEATARYAVTTFGICLTPNDYIIDIDRERGVAHIRILVGRKLSGADTAFLELK